MRDGERDTQALVNVDVADIGKAAREEVDEDVGAAGGADAEGGATEALEGEPPLADKRAGVEALLVAEPPQDLHDQLVGKTRVDPILAAHFWSI